MSKYNERKIKIKAYILLTLTASIWGSLYVASKYVLAYVPPLTVLAFRHLSAGISLLVVLNFKYRFNKSKKIIKRYDIKYILFIGCFGYFVSAGSQLIGTKLSNAGLASLINSLNPVFMILFAVPFLKEKITANKIISVIAAIIGVYIIVGNNTSGNIIGGIAASLFAAVVWSLASVVMKQLTEKYDSLVITTYSILIALGFSSVAAGIELYQLHSVIFFRGDILLGLLYIGIICTALTNVLWNQSLSMIEAGRCALFFPLQPLVATILGFLLLGEKIQISFMIGAAFIICGILLSVITSFRNRD